MTRPLIIHIPHAQAAFPPGERERLCVDDDTLQMELLRLTDWYTDELFSPPPGVPAATVPFAYSRLLCDVERFEADEKEPMASRGMGAIYTRTSHNKKLRNPLNHDEGERILHHHYRPHHRALSAAVRSAMESSGTCLIVDAHSFPSTPLPCDLDQSCPRPDICIGTDPFHTPPLLTAFALAWFEDRGLTTTVDAPYAGAMVPFSHYGQDDGALSLMVELNRALYMEERSGDKRPEFGEMYALVSDFLVAVAEVRL